MISINSSQKNNTSESRIAVVIPSLNEEKGIGLVIDGIKKTIHAYNHIILVVDGYSQDRTVEIAKQKGAYVIYQRAKGYGDALKSGFEYADNNLKADIIIMMDADGTYDPKDIPELLVPVLKNQADLVVGNRFQGMKRGAMTLTNRIGNKLLSWIVRKTLGIKITDTQCGFRALRASLMRHVRCKDNGMPFATEMLVEVEQVGAKILEVPVTYYQRIGNSKLSPLKDGIRIFKTILRLTRYYRPLLFFGGFGLSLASIGSAVGMSIAFGWVHVDYVVRLALVSLSFTFISLGLFVFIIGLLADMIRDLKRELRVNSISTF